VICCYSDVPGLSTGSLNFAFKSSLVDCVIVNPSARLNHVVRDAHKVCALAKEGTHLKVLFLLSFFSFSDRPTQNQKMHSTGNKGKKGDGLTVLHNTA